MTTIYRRILQLVTGFSLLVSCTKTNMYKQDLLSNDVDKICKAAYKLGETQDTTSVRLLLTKILDPRVSHDIRFKGMSVNQCRLGALRKISGLQYKSKPGDYKTDTLASELYLNWAINKGYVKDKSEISLNYYLRQKK
jgi:hypothetical protein